MRETVSGVRIPSSPPRQKEVFRPPFVLLQMGRFEPRILRSKMGFGEAQRNEKVLAFFREQAEERIRQRRMSDIPILINLPVGFGHGVQAKKARPKVVVILL